MKPDEEILDSLHQDLSACRNYLRQVSQGIIKGEVSKYPIFIAMRSVTDIDLGLPIINKNELEITWSFNASHLEDFVNSQIIANDKVDPFKQSYKNPTEYMCVFVAEEGAMCFVYMPYERPQSSLVVSQEQLN
jgi:hypothetical protein